MVEDTIKLQNQVFVIGGYFLRKAFHHYYRYSESEFKSLWDECSFVFDTNVLLNFYRYSSLTREELLKIFENVKKRVFIPHQVALEYQERRHDVILGQIKAYDEVQTKLDAKKAEFKDLFSEFSSRKRHPYIENQKILEEKLEKWFHEVCEELLSSKNKELGFDLKKDKIRDRITELFDKKVGEPFPLSKLEEIYKKGKERYDNKIPPGFMDDIRQKDGKRKYGDLILWLQIIKYATDNHKDIIFITDDNKKDWWSIAGEKRIGPRPELIKELFDEAKTRFYMYSSWKFMQYYQEYFRISVNSEAIKEVEIQSSPGIESCFTIGSPYCKINGTEMAMDVAPYVKNNRVYLPLRFVAYALGIKDSNILWDGNFHTITLLKHDKVIQLRINSEVMLINGAQVAMETL